MPLFQIKNFFGLYSNELSELAGHHDGDGPQAGQGRNSEASNGTGKTGTGFYYFILRLLNSGKQNGTVTCAPRGVGSLGWTSPSGSPWYI